MGALVGWEAESDVSVVSVEAPILEYVGAELICEVDAPSFLLHVDEYA
jgi:hypothetical protein